MVQYISTRLTSQVRTSHLGSESATAMHGSKSQEFSDRGQPSHTRGTSKQPEGARLYHPIRFPCDYGFKSRSWANDWRRAHLENSSTYIYDLTVEHDCDQDIEPHWPIRSMRSWLIRSMLSWPEISYSVKLVDTEWIGTNTVQFYEVIQEITGCRYFGFQHYYNSSLGLYKWLILRPRDLRTVATLSYCSPDGHVVNDSPTHLFRLIGMDENLLIQKPKVSSHESDFTPPTVRKTIQTLSHFKRAREKVAQKPLLVAHSDILQPSPQSSKELLSDLKKEIEFWGGTKLTAWKAGCGQSKEWRRCRYYMANRKQPAKNQSNRSSWSFRHKIFPSVLPVNMLRRDPTLRFSNWRRKGPRRTNTTTSQYSAQEILWREQAEETYDDDLKPVKSDKLSLDAAQTVTSISKNPELNRPGKREHESDFVIPYENFIGAILGTTFRILKLLRSESHGDVYDLEDLSAPSTRYEAKAYTLRSLPSNTYRYRVRNLKRLAAKPSFLCSIDQHGRKFVINGLEGKQDEPSTLSSEAFKSPQSSKLGAIGRRNSPEYNSAFPELPKAKDSIPTFTSTYGRQSVSAWDKFSPSSRTGERVTKFSRVHHTTLHNILAPVQLFLQEAEALCRVPQGSSDYIAAIVKEAYTAITTVENEAADNVSICTTTLTPHFSLQPYRRATEEQQRKVKTPEQRERLRARQQESRIRKRAQKKAASAKDACDSV